ncbi:MAG: element excision factor XisH family protein [Saprospiraceae bacterium]
MLILEKILRFVEKIASMAKDIFHDQFRRALEKDGWSITHDPFSFRVLGLEGEVDLGAEKILAAEKTQDGQKVRIVVEIKSFIGPSFMRDFHVAVGQYTNYKVFIGVVDAERQIYLAVTKTVFDKKFTIPGVQLVLQVAGIKVVTFDEVLETIVLWEN